MESLSLTENNFLDQDYDDGESIPLEGKPREACGVFAVYGHPEAARLTFFGLFALQHRGQESAGIAIFDGNRIIAHRAMGLASEVFKEETLARLPGKIAIGHVRYSTMGSSVLSNAQPFLVHFDRRDWALAHNGSIVNAPRLRFFLEARGSIFQSTMDTEVIIHLMAPSLTGNIENALRHALNEVQGSYSLVMLAQDRLIAARDPYGLRPLSLGRLGDAWVVASETCALDLVGARYERDVAPGEAIIIDENGLRSFRFAEERPQAHCIFELVYFSRPDSDIFGENVYLFRKALGRNLAREYRPEVDFVMPFPDSGNYAALGYAGAAGLPFEMGMIRNHYVGRTFIQPSQAMRDFAVRVKLNPVKELVEGKRVLVVEDSIVRGTTSRSRIKSLRATGAKEVHMAVSCPPTRHPCPYGIDFSHRGELIASQREKIDEIAAFIGLDSLHYISVEGMVGASAKDPGRFCLGCFTGEYPINPERGMDKFSLE